jgi:trk system potassium uptake protein TrkA
VNEDGKAAFKVVINDSPLPMDIIEEDDIVVIVGNDKNLDKLFHDLEEN